jgi:hypothetical protein
MRRYAFIAGAATLLVLLVSWVAVRAVGPAQSNARVPLMVQPTMPLGDPVATQSALPSVVPSPSPSGSASASPTPSRTPSKSPAKPTEKATKPAPRRTTTPPAPAAAFAAQYKVAGDWDRGFVAAIEVTNKTGPARTWTLKVTYAAEDGVRVGNTWNAQLSRQGNTFVLTGGPLAPGATVSVGYEASKQVRSRVEPSSCTVDGVRCGLG